MIGSAYSRQTNVERRAVKPFENETPVRSEFSAGHNIYLRS